MEQWVWTYTRDFIYKYLSKYLLWFQGFTGTCTCRKEQKTFLPHSSIGILSLWNGRTRQKSFLSHSANAENGRIGLNRTETFFLPYSAIGMSHHCGWQNRVEKFSAFFLPYSSIGMSITFEWRTCPLLPCSAIFSIFCPHQNTAEHFFKFNRESVTYDFSEAHFGNVPFLSVDIGLKKMCVSQKWYVLFLF